MQVLCTYMLVHGPLGQSFNNTRIYGSSIPFRCKVEGFRNLSTYSRLIGGVRSKPQLTPVFVAATKQQPIMVGTRPRGFH